MTGFLSLVEKLVPRLLLYPRWAQALFTATFALTLTSLFVFVALASGAHRKEQTSAFRSDLSFDVTPAGQSAQVRQATRGLQGGGAIYMPAHYDATQSKAALRLGVVQPYLTALASNGVIRGTDSTLELWAADVMPTLDIVVTNNSSKTIVLHPVVTVEKSSPDATPVPVLVYGLRSFVLHNEGWGPVSHAVVRFNLGAPNAAPDFSAPLRNRIAVTRPDRIDLTPALRRAGVDVATIKRLERRTPALAIVPASSALRAALGPFKAREALAYGVLTYSWKPTAASAQTSKSVRFATPVVLVRQLRPPLTSGILQPSASYTVLLRTAGAGYRCTIEPHQITPGLADRIEISLRPPRSSTQRLHVMLELSDGTKLASREIDLQAFAPRGMRYSRPPSAHVVGCNG